MNLLDIGTTWKATSEDQELFEGRDRDSGELKWTGSRVDLVFGISYQDDIEKTEKVLQEVVEAVNAAEITLQPVRRYGVDAAVLYSDIVVPPHAVGFGIDVTPGTGPVAEVPLRQRDDLKRLRPLEIDDVGR